MIVRETPLRLRTAAGEMFGVLASSDAAEPRTVLRRSAQWREWCAGSDRTGRGSRSRRRWAARGVPVVRIDLEGIGDSDGELERPLPDAGLYRSQQTGADALDPRPADRARTPGQVRARGPVLRRLLGPPRGARGRAREHVALAQSVLLLLGRCRSVLERDRRASMAALRSGFVKRVLSGRVRADLVRRGVRSLIAPRPGSRGTSAEERQTPHNERALDQLRDQDTQRRVPVRPATSRCAGSSSAPGRSSASSDGRTRRSSGSRRATTCSISSGCSSTSTRRSTVRSTRRSRLRVAARPAGSLRS